MKLSSLLSIVLASHWVVAAFAADTATENSTAKIAAILQKRYPDAQFKQIAPASQLPGFYEIVTSSGLAYTDAEANVLIVGTFFDTRTRENLTARRWNELRAIDFEALPFELAIKTVKGEGRRRLVVFSDPDCPYCKKLEEGIKDLTDVTIYTFLYPLQDLHPDAQLKAQKIWCASERGSAWSNWMLAGTLPPTAECGDDPLPKLKELGRKLTIDSTPTLFLANGRRIEGVVKGAELDAALSESSALAAKAP